jgi:hypothetical protein
MGSDDQQDHSNATNWRIKNDLWKAEPSAAAPSSVIRYRSSQQTKALFNPNNGGAWRENVMTTGAEHGELLRNRPLFYFFARHYLSHFSPPAV